MTQEAAFQLNIRGSADTIQSMIQIEKLIAATAQELKELKKEAQNAEREYKKLVAAGDLLNKKHKSTVDELDKVNQRMKDLLSTNKQASKEYKELKERREQLTTQEAKYAKQIQNNNDQQRKQSDVINKTTTAIVQHTQAQLKSKEAHRQLGVAARQQTKDWTAAQAQLKGTLGYIPQLENQYAKLRRQIRELSKDQINSQFAKNLIKETAKVKRELDETNRRFGDFKSTIGDYDGALNRAGKGMLSFGKQALGAFGIGSALYLGVGVIQGAADTVLEFNKAQVELQSLSGQTAEQLQSLTDQALLLGRTTLFTATEVTKLQIELSKLGFSNNEIAQVTDDVINFAVALDADVAQAATVAASTLRAFGLDATEMERVVSVLGVAANKTALSFEDFEGNIATFAPVARQFGFSIEDSITLFGKLRDAGFDASTAATALRNIFLKLADPNGDLAKRLGSPVKNLDELAGALIKLKNDGIDLAEAFELTGERAVAAFGQITADSETLVGLRDSLVDVNEEFKIMVDKRLTSVDAQLKLTKSAWEGLILSIDQGDGAISEFVVDALSGFRGILGLITDINDEVVSMNALFNDLNTIAFALQTGGLSLLFGDATSSVKEQRENYAATERVIKTSVARIVEIIKNGTEEEKKLAEDKITHLRKRAEAGEIYAKSFIKQYDELQASFNKIVEDDPTGKKLGAGTIKYLEELITKLKESLETTTDETVIKQTVQQIKLLEDQLNSLQLKIKLFGTETGSLENIGLRISDLQSQLNQTGDAAKREEIKKQIVALEVQAKQIEETLKRIENKNLPSLTLDQQLSLGRKLPNFNKPIDNLFGEDDREEAERLRKQTEEADRLGQLQIQRDQEIKDVLLQQQYDFNANLEAAYSDLGALIGDVLSGQKKDTKEIFKDLLLITLKFAETQARIAAESANSISLIQAGLNPALIAKAGLEFAIRQGLISALFGLLRGIVQGFEEGGIVKGGIDFRKAGSSDNTLIHAKKGEMVLTEHNQSKAKEIFGDNVFGAMGVKGFQNNPALNNHISVMNNNSGVTKMDKETIALMRDEMREGVAAAILETRTGNRNYERKYKRIKRR